MHFTGVSAIFALNVRFSASVEDAEVAVDRARRCFMAGDGRSLLSVERMAELDERVLTDVKVVTESFRLIFSSLCRPREQ